MLNKLFVTTAQVAVLFLVILVLPSSTAANPVCKCEQQSKDSASKKVVDFDAHISEAGVKYKEKIEVDPNKRTELFEVPAHPGVDRSDVLHDFKQNLTMMRFPDSKTCYLFPLVKKQSSPEKLIKDLEKAREMVITETRRVDTTWIIDGEVTDRSVLSDELAQFCAKYRIYYVRKTLNSLTATRIEKEERTNRKRRQARNGINKLCPDGMDLNTAYQRCNTPDLKCKVTGRNCYKYVICGVGGPSQPPPPHVQKRALEKRQASSDPCWQEHNWSAITCCEYICN
ncbi:hypothetical protein ACROYT_G034670 [Oculina patagonica]